MPLRCYLPHSQRQRQVNSMATFNNFLTSLNLDPKACGSTLDMSTVEVVPAAKPKHRSCDECRTRKLACSKDPTGCERCKRESIACHYSEQKPMGRPRKRQFIETAREDPVDVPNNTILEVGDFSFIADDFNGYNDQATAEPYYTHQPGFGLPPLPAKDGRSSIIEDGRIVWHFGGRHVVAGPPINYGDVGVAALDNDLPNLSATTSNLSAPGSDSSSPQSVPAAPCGCLASMYLALASLQTFPTDIVQALKIIRGAAATAAQSIWCPQCGSIVLGTPNPPIESFQNTMLLGTILPIIANGYHRLLKMIDDETERAIAIGSTKTFRFHEYGGMCGKQEDLEFAFKCMEKEMFFNAVEMQPQQWRNTIRAMLRVDIYGHEQNGFKHKGLKDLVSEMEERQIARHQLLDQWGMSGVHFTTMENGRQLCDEEQKASGLNQPHACMQILQMAKISIDNLVIA